MSRYLGIVVAVTASLTAMATGKPVTETPEISPIPFPQLQPSDMSAKTVAIVSPVLANEAVPILGKKVLGPNGKDVVGQIVDILVDKDGKPTAAVIDVGGFLGVGSRKIAVDWKSLRFRLNDREDPVSVTLDREQLQSAPEYKESGSVTAVVMPPPAQADQTDALH